MADLRNRFSARFPKFGAGGIKIFATMLLLVVNANTILLEKGLLRMENYSTEALLAAMDASTQFTALVGVASILRLLSGIAVPLYAFLLAEGFVHTGSLKKYLGAITLTALISEPIYDYALTGKAFDFSQQNPMFALVIGLVMLFAMSRLEGREKTVRVIVSLLLALCAAFWVVVLRSEFGLETVLLAAVFYCFREKLLWKIVFGVLISVINPLGPLAMCCLIYYNGQRKMRIPQYAYYVFYPLHLLVLGVITRIFIL